VAETFTLPPPLPYAERVGVHIGNATAGIERRLTTGTGRTPLWQWGIVVFGIFGIALGIYVGAGY
jgi:hypothetical protein